ncbi:unnamed protein product [Urochloa decumbens]|uniref:F-box domain-containing protein n=1 Tax=Urochloa decumbens TaxID=240449 RepID=A0ABC9AGZ9_9POAL
MESHSRRRCRRRSNVAGSVMEEEDRLSSLPDDLLHSILRSLQLKNAASTSALSRRWAPQWLCALASSPAIDLTDRDFARGQSPSRAAATVSRCLQLHAEYGAPLHAFRIALCSGAGAFGLDVVGWVATRDVEVDLAPPQKDEGADLGAAALMELPSDVFRARSSLERLSLGGFSLASPPSRSRRQGSPVSARSPSPTPTSPARLSRPETLRVLQLLGCPAVRKLRIVAPALESFAFLGPVYFRVTEDYDIPVELGETETTAIPALRDACMCHLGFGEYENPSAQDYEYPFLYYVAHAWVLTLCYIGLLLPSDGGSCSEAVLTDESDDDDIVLDYEVVLDRLTLIKVVNFRGARRELRLLRFFLKRAPVLEQLVLATVEGEGAPGDEQLKAIRERVSGMQKASRDARISVCRPNADDSPSPNHAHPRFFHEK